MTKASEKLENDAFQFTEEGENKGVWVTLRRRATSFRPCTRSTWNSARDGQEHHARSETGKEVVIEVPSEGQIAIDDPKNGKMVYELKLGLLATRLVAASAARGPGSERDQARLVVIFRTAMRALGRRRRRARCGGRLRRTPPPSPDEPAMTQWPRYLDDVVAGHRAAESEPFTLVLSTSRAVITARVGRRARRRALRPAARGQIQVVAAVPRRFEPEIAAELEIDGLCRQDGVGRAPRRLVGGKP